MLKLIANMLEGETVDFLVWQIVKTYVDDDVTYISNANAPYALNMQVRTSSIRCASCDERGLS